MVVGDKGKGEQVNSAQYFTWVFAGIVRCVKERLPKEVKQARTNFTSNIARRERD